MDIARYFIVLLAITVVMLAVSIAYKILAVAEGGVADATEQAVLVLAKHAGPVPVSATPDNATGLSANAYASGVSIAMPFLQYISYIVAAAVAAALIWTRRR
ncbi:MAG: hypothetical protein JHC22_08035 [Thermoproteus sp.]|jgi:hypothetical protein|nr:hypothetical protein [Thermoproteus sp.]